MKRGTVICLYEKHWKKQTFQKNIHSAMEMLGLEAY